MIRDSDVAPSAILGRTRHVGDGSSAVGVLAVTVKRAANAFEGDEPGNRAFRRCFHFTPTLAQLGRNRLKPERFVKHLFRADANSFSVLADQPVARHSAIANSLLGAQCRSNSVPSTNSISADR